MKQDRLHKTGYHYVNILADEDRVFNEIFYGYQETSQRIPWLSALPWREFNDSIRSGAALTKDQNVCFIIWHDIAEIFKSHKRPTGPIIMRYCEPVGDDLWPTQQLGFNKFLSQALSYDGVLVHTEFARRFLKNRGLETKVTPIGYNSKIMGEPEFGTKELDLVFYGSHVTDRKGRNRRAEMLTGLRSHLKSKLTDISGAFWPNRHAILNKAKAILTLNHIDTPHSFPTMRIWHSITSGAGMILESTETWPAESGRHYLQIPTLKSDNIAVVAEIIDKAIKNDIFIDLAKAAYTDLSKYSYEYCFESFAIPAIQQMLKKVAD